ncbi:hypothetical protein AXF42_Ash010026 [Apostasia shenzhenica]|uniref:FLZ-type domain-containing protein n=1 Tax=Apostasia shenzhenica TaxID=1088818 RepID=A0A2I0ACP8_9ASPA|nr:hypothetical protein AXF42_Ash010026 [Apostasia shenzhenica]
MNNLPFIFYFLFLRSDGLHLGNFGPHSSLPLYNLRPWFFDPTLYRATSWARRGPTMDSSPLSSPSSSSCSLLGVEDLEVGFIPTVTPFSRRQGIYRALGPRAPARIYLEDLSDDEPQHFLDSCFLCKKPLAGNGDIFMYRGDTPFCSVECRQEQMEIDEAMENWKDAVKKERQQKQHKSSSPTKSQKIHVRTGAVVAG